jgi:alkylation response protein AidB-like acyl-CoA dehydrogenase
MNFDLSKPQQLLKESARELLQRECPPEKVRELMATATAHSDELWQAIADQGWTGMTAPEEWNGLDLTALEVCVVAEEMGRACLPGAFLSNLLATELFARAANESQKEKYLAPLALGEKRATVALLENAGGWRTADIKLSAERSGGNFVLNGKKMFVADAETADFIVCAARYDESLILLPIEKDTENLRIKPLRSMDATRKLYEVSFENVRVPTADVLGADGNAERILGEALDAATVALCAEMLGGMQWILETSVEYAKNREQFGRVIGSFQAVQHQLADMLLLTESAKSAVYYAAWALSNEDADRASRAVSVAKAYCSDAYREIANRGVQIHGGIGFTWEHDLQLYYKRAKSSEVLFGDANFHRERVAEFYIDGGKSRSAARTIKSATSSADDNNGSSNGVASSAAVTVEI